MSGPDVLFAAIRRRLPGARIEITLVGNQYVLSVASVTFSRLSNVDRQGVVYAAMERVPLDLVARVADIFCSVD